MSNFSSRATMIALILMVLITSGCERELAPPPAPRVGTPATEGEARQFAAALEDVVKKGDVQGFDALVDSDALLEITTWGIEVSPAIRAGFVQGAKEAAPALGLARTIIENTSQGGSYKSFRFHKEGNEQLVMFRLIDSLGGLNYHDIVVERRPDGKVKAIDMYIMLTGERYSSTLRRGFLPVAANANRGLLKTLSGWEHDYVKNLDSIDRMSQASQNGNSEEALAIFYRLPEGLKRDKNILIIRLLAAQNLDDNTYDTAIRDFERHFRNNSSSNLISIDGFVLRKQYDKAHNAVKRLNKHVGGDPYLNVQHAQIFLQQGNFKAASSSATQAIEELPDLEGGYWALVDISLASKNWDETTKTLDVIEKQFEIVLNDLASLPGYSEYVKSPQYEARMKARALRRLPSQPIPN